MIMRIHSHLCRHDIGVNIEVAVHPAPTQCGQSIAEEGELPEVDDQPDGERPAGRSDLQVILVYDVTRLV